MLEYFKSLIRQERPDYVIDFHFENRGQPNIVVCKYAKGQQFYFAYSYVTYSWISKKPAGPTTIKCQNLSDVAVIQVFDTIEKCNAAKTPNMDVVVKGIAALGESTISGFKSLFDRNPYGDTVDLQFNLSPIPTVTIIVRQGESLVGTMVLLHDMTVYPVMVCHERMADYVSQLRNAASVVYLSLGD